jgi:hypothetical protein
MERGPMFCVGLGSEKPTDRGQTINGPSYHSHGPSHQRVDQGVAEAGAIHAQ